MKSKHGYVGHYQIWHRGKRVLCQGGRAYWTFLAADPDAKLAAYIRYGWVPADSYYQPVQPADPIHPDRE